MADPKNDPKPDAKPAPKTGGWLAWIWNKFANSFRKESPRAPTADATPKADPAPTAGPVPKADTTLTTDRKLKARVPRGLADRGPAEIAATRVMLDTIQRVYERYGFEAVETPAIEYTDALGKFLPDQDRPNEGVFSFMDEDEWVSLRYDLTAPLARYVAENFDHLPKPYRSYRSGWVFRNEKPGPGRFRQFMQFDADIVGSRLMAADAEICMMAADTMEELGLKGHYVVKVNNRKVFDGVLEAIGLGGEENTARRLTIMRAIDKADKFPLEEIRKLLGPGRKDESGDFTKGAQLDANQINRVVRVIESRDVERLFRFYERRYTKPFTRQRYAQSIMKYFGIESLPKLIVDGLDEAEEVRKLVRAAGYTPEQIRLDPTVVRGLEYYTGPVYEVELTFPTTGDDGKSVRFGSVGGGGRYDGLVARFRREAVPATGFSIGVSRLLAALTHLGKVETTPEPGPVIVTVFDKDRIADYQRMASTLRQAGIRAELYLGAGKFGPQMKYADRRRSPCVVIQGSDEKAKGEVQIKDLIVGAELATLSKERDDYLQKQAAAQFAVPEADLVAKVREVLARHGVKWG
jgi:histidyl-tRNA synthetase